MPQFVLTYLRRVGVPQVVSGRRWYCRSAGEDGTQDPGKVTSPNSQPQPQSLLQRLLPTTSPSSPPANDPGHSQGHHDFVAGGVDNHFEFSESFKRSESWKSKLVSSMEVYTNFISTEEEASILKEIEPYLSRLIYEQSHWDNAIHAYRETERSKWSRGNEVIINRIRQLAFPPQVPQLKLVHILDLAKSGLIKPHIDSVRFCGNTIGGLSLLSDCVMRLRHEVQTDFYCDIFLPRLSLYVMRDFSRYELTHEILGESDSTFRESKVPRDRRISIICRNEPTTTTSAAAAPIFKSFAAS